MSARKDFRVTVKVRNNNILLAAEAAGYKSIPKLAEKIGCSYTLLNDLINMTYSPVDQQGSARPFVDALCAELGVPFDALFSCDQIEALKTNKSEAQINAEQLFALSNQRVGLTHDDGLCDVVDSAMGKLSPLEERVLRMRFGFDGPDMTLGAIGEIEGLCAQRIREIEQKALRKLRKPGNSVALRDYAALDP